MATEPKLPNPDIDLSEKLLGLLFTGGIDAIKFYLGPMPFIDLLGIVLFALGAVAFWSYLAMRTGFKSLFGGPKRALKIATAVITTSIGFFPVFGDFVPELTIDAGVMYYALSSENAAARKSAKAAVVPTRRQ